MKRYTIEQKFKSAAAFLVILILFPYIVSVFVNGVDPEETTNENFYIRVKASEEEEADGIAEVEWNEYLTGVLAKDVPADTETEALKAQGGSCEDTDQPCAAKKHSGRRDGESKVGQNRKCIRCYFGDRLFVAEGNAGSMACR